MIAICVAVITAAVVGVVWLLREREFRLMAQLFGFKIEVENGGQELAVQPKKGRSRARPRGKKPVDAETKARRGPTNLG